MSEETVEQVDQSQGTVLETPAEVAQGGSGNDFYNMIPEDLRDHPSLSPIKDVGNLAKSYINAQQLIGADKLAAPKNPSEEQLSEIYNYLGKPETPDAYEVAVDGNIITEEAANSYKDVAHKLNLTPQQASGILEYYKGLATSTQEQAVQNIEYQREQVENDLKKEWGQAYEQKISGAGQAIREYGNPEMLEWQLADGTKLGNHPEFIKAFANIADFRQSVTSEDTISNTTSSSAMTPAEAQAEVNAIMSNPKDPYWDKNSISHRQQIERVQELYGMIHG
jgi:hypothetical protein